MSKLWFSFDKVTAHANNMVQVDLNELTQYSEQTVILVSHTFNGITHNVILNLLSTVKVKQKTENNIKDQAELEERPGADFNRVFRDHIKVFLQVRYLQ